MRREKDDGRCLVIFSGMEKFPAIILIKESLASFERRSGKPPATLEKPNDLCQIRMAIAAASGLTREQEKAAN